MAKFPEAEARLTRNKFVCKRCKTVIKSTNLRILGGKVKCRKCKGSALRPSRKK
jgi:predicted Zn finger-like uncharacterized protein